MKSIYESEFIIYLVSGNASIYRDGIEYKVDHAYREPLFDENYDAEAEFTSDGFLIRIERPLYDIFIKSSMFNNTY